MRPWISVDDLRARLDDDALRIVDVRFVLGQPDAGRVAYEEAHLPRAVYLDLERDLSAPTGRHGGRHPLPDVADLAGAFGRTGIGDATHVVVYDAAEGMVAGRLWWLLRWLGHDAVQVLDGGFAAWTAAGGPLTAARPDVTPVAFTPRPRPEMSIDRASLRSRLHDRSLRVVDARAGERYRGDIEPLDPRPGHVPGAVNLPYAGNVRDGRFRDLGDLRARYAPLLDAPEIVVYCGSGVSAAHDLMVLSALGRDDARLYPGSWSDWVSYADAEVALGDGPAFGPDGV